jgi:hypothetical protein
MAAPALLSAQGTLCSKSPATRPCLDQPLEGDTKATGQLTINQVAAPTTAQVTIYINGRLQTGSAQINKDGSFSFSGINKLSQYDTVRADQTGVPLAGPTTGDVKVSPPAAASASATSSLFTLGLFGVNATGSASSGPSQQYFAEFNLIAPLRYLGPLCGEADANDPLTERCWVWVDPRIASIPTATSAAVSSLSASSLATGVAGQTTGQITQSFEFQAGAEYYVIKPSATNFWGSGNSAVKSALSLVVGGGSVTPFSTATGTQEFALSSNLGQQFSQFPSLESTYPQLATALCSYTLVPGPSSPSSFKCPSPLPTTAPTIVAFVLPNRTRFYRDYYAGLRLRFFYYTGSCKLQNATGNCTLSDIYPGTFDLRFGEDETVTGGHLVPLVMTLSGSFPIPGTKGGLRVFGSSYLRLYRNRNTPALILVPPTTTLPLNSSALVVQQTTQADQDYYRLGIGLDLVAVISQWFNKPKPTSP